MHRTILLLCSLLFLASDPLPAQPKPAELPPRAVLVEKANAAVEALNKLYWSPTLSIWLDRPGDDVRGHYEGRINPPWWSCANVVESLTDLMNATGTKQYDAMIETLHDVQRDKQNKKPRIFAELKKRGQWSDADEEKFRKREAEAAERARNRKPGEPLPLKAAYGTDFRNEYLDDSAWWGIAWLRYYDRTKAPKYLATARAIHSHMARNWKPEKDGGIMWCEDADKSHPNAITNSLFIILSARLYERTREEAYLQWATQCLEWYRAKALYDGVAVVDAPGHKGDYWTYNQGTYLGALLAMHQATGKSAFLDEAAQAADTILSRSGIVLPDGVIFEKLGLSGWDPALFKGVFARYLGQLRDALNGAKAQPEVVAKIDRVLQASASSLLATGPEADGQYLIEWQKNPREKTRNYNTQAAAIALLTSLLPQPRP